MSEQHVQPSHGVKQSLEDSEQNPFYGELCLIRHGVFQSKDPAMSQAITVGYGVRSNVTCHFRRTIVVWLFGSGALESQLVLGCIRQLVLLKTKGAFLRNANWLHFQKSALDSDLWNLTNSCPTTICGVCFKMRNPGIAISFFFIFPNVSHWHNTMWLNWLVKRTPSNSPQTVVSVFLNSKWPNMSGSAAVFIRR